jgi:regulator of protease activity HflC (stomatin/prohibitin superfamily)
MNTQKHTDGPWGIFNRYNDEMERVNAIYSNNDGTKVASVEIWRGLMPEAESEANARLIAAAPELLAALKGLMQRAVEDAEKYAQNGNEPIWAYISDASDAIAKAEGVK